MPTTLSIRRGQTVHFNSNDLEDGNFGNGLSRGTGTGRGAWRLRLWSNDIQAPSYIRTAHGFLTSMHDLVALGPTGTWHVPIFNPGSNPSQVSRLRLVNLGLEVARVTVTGIDDTGDSPGGPVVMTVPVGASKTITAAELEAGAEGIEGALGDGAGKWRLGVVSDQPIRVMSLLKSPTGHRIVDVALPADADRRIQQHPVDAFPVQFPSACCRNTGA